MNLDDSTSLYLIAIAAFLILGASQFILPWLLSDAFNRVYFRRPGLVTRLRFFRESSFLLMATSGGLTRRKLVVLAAGHLAIVSWASKQKLRTWRRFSDLGRHFATVRGLPRRDVFVARASLVLAIASLVCLNVIAFTLIYLRATQRSPSDLT